VSACMRTRLMSKGFPITEAIAPERREDAIFLAGEIGPPPCSSLRWFEKERCNPSLAVPYTAWRINDAESLRGEWEEWKEWLQFKRQGPGRQSQAPPSIEAKKSILPENLSAEGNNTSCSSNLRVNLNSRLKTGQWEAQGNSQRVSFRDSTADGKSRLSIRATPRMQDAISYL
jgi:hypothetical protein